MEKLCTRKENQNETYDCETTQYTAKNYDRAGSVHMHRRLSVHCGKPEYGQLNPDERVDVETAIEIFTRNGAMAMEKEDETGTIEPGKSADFIVINQNILEIPVEKIHQTKVLKTVLQGHTVYEAR